MIRDHTELLLSLRLKPWFVVIPFHFLCQILETKCKTGMPEVDARAHFSNAVFFFPQIIEIRTLYHPPIRCCLRPLSHAKLLD